jgi:hypothetical protein
MLEFLRKISAAVQHLAEEEPIKIIASGIVGVVRKLIEHDRTLEDYAQRLGDVEAAVARATGSAPPATLGRRLILPVGVACPDHPYSPPAITGGCTVGGCPNGDVPAAPASEAPTPPAPDVPPPA